MCPLCKGVLKVPSDQEKYPAFKTLLCDVCQIIWRVSVLNQLRVAIDTDMGRLRNEILEAAAVECDKEARAWAQFPTGKVAERLAIAIRNL